MRFDAVKLFGEDAPQVFDRCLKAVFTETMFTFTALIGSGRLSSLGILQGKQSAVQPCDNVVFIRLL